jgi:hypothetical protein
MLHDEEVGASYESCDRADEELLVVGLQSFENMNG